MPTPSGPTVLSLTVVMSQLLALTVALAMSIGDDVASGVGFGGVNGVVLDFDVDVAFD